MRERLALLREYLKNRLAFGKNKKTRKGFILTMVALVEVLAISVVSVSAWVETISQLQLKLRAQKLTTMFILMPILAVVMVIQAKPLT